MIDSGYVQLGFEHLGRMRDAIWLEIDGFGLFMTT